MKILKVRWKPWKTAQGTPWRAPRQARWFPRLVDMIGPAYVRSSLGLVGITLKGSSHLVQALEGVRDQGDRLLVAFRHCGDADSQALWYALSSLAHRDYRSAGLKRPHFLFLASAEIALWGGGLASFALKSAGTLALAHGPGARVALDAVRDHWRSSPDPVVIAPEGQISYELHGPLRLDPGAANVALWAAQSAPGVAKIVPIGLRYLCADETWPRWSRFMQQLERETGAAAWASDEPIPTGAAARLRALWAHVLQAGEDYYRHKHRRNLDSHLSLNERCQNLTRVAVELAAHARNLSTGEDSRPTIFELRATALDVVFPGTTDQSPLQRQLDDRAAAEAWWNNRHQDLADVLNYLHPDAVEPDLSLERAVEAALNLADVALRLTGGHIGNRPRYFRRVLEITVGEPWVVAREDDRPRKVRAAEITNQIRAAFEQLRR